jgi:dTDP-4-amino-4,6-dideoxygalactose transaminase
MALRVKFSHLKEIIASRHKSKVLYEQGLGGIEGLTVFKDRPQTESVAQNFVVCCKPREQLFDFLKDHEIIAQRPYLPLHQMAGFKGIKKAKFPVSVWYSDSALHLPLYSFMSHQKVRDVVGCCRSFFAGDI